MSKVGRIILVLSLIGNLFIIYVAYKALGYRAHINEFLDKYTAVVEEFSGRRTYQEDNKRFQSDMLVPDRIVFFGSQLTTGWDVEQSFPEYETINRGIDGQRVSGFLLRFVPDVIELRPAAVIIEFASYNFRPQYSLKEVQDYVASMATLALANDIEPILTTVIPARSHLDYESYAVSDSLVKYNSWLIEFCAQHDYRCLDYYGLLVDENGLLPEGLSVSDIELNEKGYEILTHAIRESCDQIQQGER